MPLQAFAARLESTVLQHVFGCWQGARTDPRVPTWTAIAALTDAVIGEHCWGWRLDAATDEMIGFLMGPRPCALYGTDAVGMRLHDFYSGDLRTRVDANMREVIDIPALHRASGMIYWREGRADLGERMVLPLRFASDDKPDALIGVTVFDYTMLGAVAPSAPAVQDIEMVPLYG